MEYRILGALEVFGRTAARVDLGGERQRKLLAILLLNANLTVAVERLVDELWADPPSTARRQVYNGTAALRRRLVGAGFPATTICADAGGYRVQLGEAVLDAAQDDLLFGDAVGQLQRGQVHGPVVPGGAQQRQDGLGQLRQAVLLPAPPAETGSATLVRAAGFS